MNLSVFFITLDHAPCISTASTATIDFDAVSWADNQSL